MAGRKEGTPKTGGRKPGTPNKKTQDLFRICEEEGVEPFRALVKLANPDLEGMDLEQRLAAYQQQFSALKEICQYLHPKRKAIEVDNKEVRPLIIESLDGRSLRISQGAPASETE